MSTCFEVYPSINKIPTYNEVIDKSNFFLFQFLRSIGVQKEPMITVNIRKNKTHDIINIDLNCKAIWPEDCYAWFTISGVVGGCDAYIYNVEELDMECWKEEFIQNPRALYIKNTINELLETGFYWSFRRSAGQPALVNLSYGLVAAAFSQLSDGIIFSNDKAWDYEIFPCTCYDFLPQYFNTNCKDKDFSDWAKQCINEIQKELA